MTSERLHLTCGPPRQTVHVFFGRYAGRNVKKGADRYDANRNVQNIADYYTCQMLEGGRFQALSTPAYLDKTVNGDADTEKEAHDLSR